MRRTLVLCLVSAGLGGFAAVVVSDPPRMVSRIAAQEAYRQPHPAGRVPARSPALPSAAASLPGLEGLEDLTPEERVNVAVYESCNRGVVHITTKSVRAEPLLMIAVEIPSEGEGSGVVLDRDGHILTNYHVIDGAQEIRATLFDGKSYPGKEVGHDRVTDVAVVKIDAPRESLFPIAFGDSTRLRVGQRVFAIGNPFGFERTLTTGIVSSLNRSLPSRTKTRTIRNVIQIDAAINPGNSGGPLIDTRGRMIGMNTAIASRTGESAGVGFAIPVNTVARIIPQLIQNGRVIRPDIGIARVYQMEEGLLIATLDPEGAAARAGLRGPQVVRQRRRQGPFVYEYKTVDRSAADLIVAVDGEKIRGADDFLNIIESKQPGDTVALSIVRDGRRMEVPVRLDASP